MAEIRDVMVYLCERYPFPDDLSKARLNKLIYLADWRMAIERGHQLTDIDWVYNHYGPYVGDIGHIAQESPEFEVTSTLNLYGSPKEVIRVVSGTITSNLSPEEVDVLDHVINTTARLNFGSFLNLVYSTYPIEVSEKHQYLNLVALAAQYGQPTPV